MRACFDAQAGLGEHSGIGRYVRELTIRMPSLAGADEFSPIRFRRPGLPAPAGEPVAVREIRWLPRRAVQRSWSLLRWPPFDLLAGRFDVYHFPNFVSAPLRRGRCVLTVHDASFVRVPDSVEEANRAYLVAEVGRSLRQADAVITISAFTGAELVELFDVPPEKIVPIPLGVTGFPAPDEARAADVLRGLGIDRPFLLHVGTIEPRKNYDLMVEILERLEHFDGQLVLCGRPGWHVAPIRARILASHACDRIVLTGAVPDEALGALYARASAFLFPTRYEGFGLPPLEALACGTPVVAARVASLPEVLGDAAELVDGYDPDAWAARVHEQLSRGEDAAARARRNAWAARFRWEETARRTWDVYRKVADGVPAGQPADE